MILTRRRRIQTMTAALSLGVAGRAVAAHSPLYGTWTGIGEFRLQQLTLRFFVDAKGVVVTTAA